MSYMQSDATAYEHICSMNSLCKNLCGSIEYQEKMMCQGSRSGPLCKWYMWLQAYQTVLQSTWLVFTCKT